MSGIRILVDGTLEVGDLENPLATKRLAGATIEAQGTASKIESYVVNWLTANGLPGWACKVLSRTPLSYAVTANGAIPNWWEPERIR